MPEYTGDVRLLWPSRFLKAADLKEVDRPLTISYLNLDDLQMAGGDEQTKPVLYFKECLEASNEKDQKRLVCNKTNAATLIKLLGPKAKDWKGKRITLFPTKCQSFGELVDCIRIRSEVPEPAKETA